MKRTGGNVPHSSNLHSRSERKKWTFAKPTNGRRDRAIKKRTINLQVITIVGRTFRGDDGEREDTLQRTERSPSEENKQPINNIHDASFFLFHCWRDRPRPFRRWAPLCAETERGFERTSLGFLLPSFPPSILSHLLALGKKGLHEKEKNATTKPVWIRMGRGSEWRHRHAQTGSSAGCTWGVKGVHQKQSIHLSLRGLKYREPFCGDGGDGGVGRGGLGNEEILHSINYLHANRAWANSHKNEP